MKTKIAKPLTKKRGIKDGYRELQQEKAILEATECVCKLMQEQKISRTALANKLGATKGYVSQVLNGETNMTIRTLSDLMTLLGYELRVSAVPFEIEQH